MRLETDTENRQCVSRSNVVPVSCYRIAPRKVSPGQQFTGKNSPRPAAARAERNFTGKLSAGWRLFFWGAIL